MNEESKERREGETEREEEGWGPCLREGPGSVSLGDRGAQGSLPSTTHSLVPLCPWTVTERQQ